MTQGLQGIAGDIGEPGDAGPRGPTGPDGKWKQDISGPGNWCYITDIDTLKKDGAQNEILVNSKRSFQQFF